MAVEKPIAVIRCPGRRCPMVFGNGDDGAMPAAGGGARRRRGKETEGVSSPPMVIKASRCRGRSRLSSTMGVKS